MSIRLRLTLLYSGILAITLILLSVVLYLTQSQLTLDTLRTTLAREAQEFAQRDRRPPVHDGEGIASPSMLPGRWMQTRDPQGEVSARTPDLDASLPLSSAGLKAVQSGKVWTETAQVQNEPLLIFSEPVVREGEVQEIVQVAAPLDQREQSLGTLRLILLIGCGLVIVAAFGVGWGLAGMALRPIDRITQTAQAIGAEHDFSRRVQHVGPNDEVGRLAVIFNRMLNELEQSYRQVEQALHAQRRFVADASHELRTPLTTILGNLELLRRQPPLEEGDRAQALADTEAETERMIRLVNQLLSLARADAGRTLAQAPVPVAPLIEDVCRQGRLLAPERQIDCDTAADVGVLADRDALKQVLLILVENALVHTPPGATITLSARAQEGQVAIAVRDTGPGIPPKSLPHVFKRFWRGQSSRSGPGTGLGLSIAWELVQAQGGDIGVESRVGGGSTFTVTLPLA